VIQGALMMNDAALREQLYFIQKSCGAVPGPQDCFLVLRGIKTLHVRMQRHCENGAKVAHWLRNNPKVAKVYWPGFEDHPGHAIAARQMKDFGGMLSIQVAGGERAALDLTTRLKLFTRATSLGGPESLIEHRASVEGPTTISPRNLLRVSVGLEHADDLIEDLGKALSH
jgi:cystathionine beta-lyase